jgi:hypothetical protein
MQQTQLTYFMMLSQGIQPQWYSGETQALHATHASHLQLNYSQPQNND